MVEQSESRLMSVQRASPLAGVSEVSVSTGQAEDSAVKITEMGNMAIVQVFAKHHQIESLATLLGIKSVAAEATVTADYTALPLGPGQWVLTASTGDAGEFCEKIRTLSGDLAYVSEQSHSRVIIRVSGPRARHLLQKGCRLDLHPNVASAGFCAQTPMAQVGVLMHQLDETPTYDLHIYSGFARSFWHWLTESAAQYGYTVG